MGYRNKTYLIFDGDKDMWAYAYMKGWNSHDHMDFDFYDAHDIRPLTDRAMDETIRARLRQRLSNTKQAIVLIGELTRYHHKFVRWELETCLNQRVPIVAVNLNGHRRLDLDRCPPILRDEYVVHVPLKMKIIRHALDHFPVQYANRDHMARGPLIYGDALYQQLGLLD